MTSSTLAITQAGLTDLPILQRISAATFRETFSEQNSPADIALYEQERFSETQLATELAEPGSTFWLASDESDVVGYAKLRTAKLPEQLAGERPVELERLYVLKAYQSRKAGAALMGFCIDYARRQGFSVLWLGVWEHNEKAIRFYQKWGFSVFGSHIFQLGQAQDTDYLMRKELEPEP